MLTYFLADQNFPFSVALAIVIAIAALEGVLTLLGFGLSAMLDGLSADVDIPDVDIDADQDGVALDHGGSFGSVLAWLRFGEVPAVILLIVFLSAFGALGIALQSVVNAVTGIYLPAFLAAIPAMFGAIPTVRVLGGVLGRIMPKEETAAVSRQTLIGRVATITLGAAAAGKPAQGKVRDEHGLEHYVMIEPDEDQQTFAQGNEVLLVRNKGAIYYAIANDYGALGEKS